MIPLALTDMLFGTTGLVVILVVAAVAAFAAWRILRSRNRFYLIDEDDEDELTDAMELSTDALSHTSPGDITAERPQTPVRPQTCPSCSWSNRGDASFCTNCGGALRPDEFLHQMGFTDVELRLTVGRDQAAALHISESTISNRHALVRFSQGTLTLEDLNSVNGTFINRHRITEPTLLVRGDTLHFARTKVTYSQIIARLSREIRVRSTQRRIPTG